MRPWKKTLVVPAASKYKSHCMAIRKTSFSSSERPGPRYDITALQRGLQLLSLLAEAETDLSATQISQRSKLHSSTVHRFLVNLENSGYIARNEQGNYSLGPRCIALGHAALHRLDVRRVSLPELAEINRLTRETIHLTIRNGLNAIYVEKFDSPEPLRIFSRIGALVPLHCTAVGKVLLAYLPPQERSALIQKLELTRFTPATIGSVQQLNAELDSVRMNGYAFDNEEHESHIQCIAGPILNHDGAIVAAFSVTGPATRMHNVRLRQLIPLVQKTSQSISRALGYMALPEVREEPAGKNQDPRPKPARKPRTVAVERKPKRMRPAAK